MKSCIYTKKNIFFGTYDIQYHAELPLPEDKISLQKTAWKLLHFVLPREIRSGGIMLNIKGIRSNNILLNDLDTKIPESEDLTYALHGLNPPDEVSEADSSEQDDSFYYCIKSEFSDFPDKKNIRYKSNIFYDGNINDFISSPVFIHKDKLEVNSIFLGLEFFEPNFFACIGFAPRIKHSLALKTDNKSLKLRFRSEQVKKPESFFYQFSETGKNLAATIDEVLSANIEEDFQRLILEKFPKHS